MRKMIEIKCPQCGRVFWYNGSKERTVCPFVDCCAVIKFDAKGKVIEFEKPVNNKNGRKKKV